MNEHLTEKISNMKKILLFIAVFGFLSMPAFAQTKKHHKHHHHAHNLPPKPPKPPKPKLPPLPPLPPPPPKP